MAFDQDGDITSSKSDLICLERIMEYEKVDYGRPSQYLEDKLAILKIYNIVCGNFIKENTIAHQVDDVMPGYDLTYKLFQSIDYALAGDRIEFGSTVRDSVPKELFYSLYTYLEMSAICGREGWCDINKILRELMQELLSIYTFLGEELEIIIENWPDKSMFVPTRVTQAVIDWVSEFLESLQEK
jgi:hypothetical protein